MSDLERSYRRLLVAYPSWYRERLGDEILSTLLDAAGPDRCRPAAGEAAHLLAHGMAVRADLGASGVIGRVVGVAASPGLASAGVFAVVAFVFGEWAPWAPSLLVPPAHFGPFLTVGPVVYLAWVVTALLDVATRSRHQRTAVAAAMAVTVACVPVGDHLRAGRPPLFVLGALAALGLPALLRGTPTLAPAKATASVVAALATACVLATAVVPVIAGTVSYFRPGAYARVAFYQSGMATLSAWLPLLAVIVLTGAAVALIAGWRETSGGVALLVAPWLALSAVHAPRASTQDLSAALVAVVGTVMLAAGVAHQRALARCQASRA